MIFYQIARVVTNIYLKILYKVKVIGKENIPKTGSFIICSNHSRLIDPVALGLATKRKLNFMAKKELFDNKILGLLLRNLGAFPVDRNSADISAIKLAIKILREGKLFAIFPEGTRSKDSTDIDIDVKPGIGMISIKSKAPIIPIYIESKYKFRKPLNIMVKKPIDFSKYYEKKLGKGDYIKLSRIVVDEIYS